MVALGKLGGRELNFHSDLDLIFVYEEDGMTAGRPGDPPIANVQFFSDVARRIVRTLAEASGLGHLYTVDARLRPHGSAGPLAVPLAVFRDYYGEQAQVWERLALTRARVLRCRRRFGERVGRAICDVMARPIPVDRLRSEVRAMRRKLESSRGPGDIKRGAGGLADIEFVMQYLQVRHAEVPGVCRANFWETIEALAGVGLIAVDAARDLRSAYEFIWTVENRLRLQRNRVVPDWPTQFDEVARLVAELRRGPADPVAAVADFRAEVARTLATTRGWYENIVGTTNPC